MEAGAYPAGGSTVPDGEATTEMPSLGAGSKPGPAYPADASNDSFAQRPEAFVGAAFVGGLVLAQVLKRVGR
jgi:hypothetical protein